LATQAPYCKNKADDPVPPKQVKQLDDYGPLPV